MESQMTRRLTIVMAVGCGVSVGNIYYAQPLLDAIAADLKVGYAQAGLIVTLSQIGYVLGLLLLVPLGDLFQRRRMVVRVLVLTCLALAGVGLAPSLSVLDVAIVIVGITTVIPQILIPFAAELAAEGERGKVVGTVMSGLLLGILLARTVAGVLAQLGSWRVAFLAASGAMLALAALLYRELPEVAPTSTMPYRRLMGSIVAIARADSIVRWRSAFGSIAFACFSVLWTSIAFVLAGPPYHYGPALIGLFGLLGAGGALMASVAGRLADAGHTKASTGALFGLMTGSFALLALGRSELAALVVGIVLLDLSVQGVHILNQATIYARRPESRGRVTTIYMVSYFTGGAAGSAAAAGIFAAYGWQATCAVGAGLGALGLLAWLIQSVLETRGSQRSSGEAEGSAPMREARREPQPDAGGKRRPDGVTHS